MKNKLAILMCVLLIVGGALSFAAPSALAIKNFKAEFEAKYVKPDSGNREDIALATAVATAKCNVCHVGKSKKNRNPYGAALSELLDKKEDKNNKEKIRAALDRVARMKVKSGDENSPTFGERLAQGNLPIDVFEGHPKEEASGKTPPPQSVKQKRENMEDITLKQARAVINAAVAKAEAIGTKMDIAVVDAGANLKAFVRMDGAWLGSIDIAIKKARTARLFDMNSGEIGKLSQPGGPLYNIEHSNCGLISFPGGVPITDAAGRVIGAIGVSGSTVENDHAVAQAGAAAIAPGNEP